MEISPIAVLIVTVLFACTITWDHYVSPRLEKAMLKFFTKMARKGPFTIDPGDELMSADQIQEQDSSTKY